MTRLVTPAVCSDASNASSCVSRLLTPSQNSFCAGGLPLDASTGMPVPAKWQ
jgi:hypothetical protein